MDSRTNILSMLGLALRGHRLVVGEEPVEAVARARDARVLLLASDAADNTKRRCRHFAEAGQCLYLTLPYTKAELGQVTGRSAVAICALTDVGMAASFVHKLELLDPKAYSEAAQRLDVKAKRAAERKAELQAHEKNLRQGKCKKKPAEQPAPEAAPAEERPVQDRADRKSGYRRGGPRREGGKPYSGQHRSDRKPRTDGEQQPFGQSADGRKPYGDRKPYGGKKPYTGKSRPSKENRPKPRAKANPYAHSLPVKKGKGSFRKQQG